MKKVLEHHDDCWMCSSYTKRGADGKLKNHRMAGFNCAITNTHVHCESPEKGVSVRGYRILQRHRKLHKMKLAMAS